MSQTVLVSGVGMAPFLPAGVCESLDSMGSLAGRAIRAALADARIDYDLVDQVFTSCVQGEEGTSEQVLARIGLEGIPIFNLRDGCVSASSAFQLARQSVLSGESECTLAVGFDCTPPGRAAHRSLDLSERFFDGERGMRDPLAFLTRRQHPGALFAGQIHWLTTRMATAQRCFDRVIERSRAQGALNPFAACYPVSWSANRLASYLCQPASGAAAVLLCSPTFAARYGARTGVAVLASERGSDRASEQESQCVLDVLGRATTRRVAQQAYAQAGVGCEDIDVVELHDHCVGDVLVNSAALGLCQDDEIERFILHSQGHRKGLHAVCPSGGLLGRGHVPGADALAQIAELVWQIRGEAGPRQIPGARTALQHSTAVGRAVTVTILQRT
jgi:acetyl-CoA acetyltransferase